MAETDLRAKQVLDRILAEDDQEPDAQGRDKAEAIITAALAAVQQETIREDAKWMRHGAWCGYAQKPGGECVCGLSEHLKAQSAPKAPRPEAAPAGSPQPLRRDLARLLDSFYGLHFRSGHLDAMLEVIDAHAPVAVPIAPPGGLVDHLQGSDRKSK